MSDTPDPVVQSAARWFWWIAGLSLVNAVMFHTGSGVNFVVGLAMTTLASMAFAQNLPVSLTLVGLTIGFYFLMGLYAQRRALWAFYLGLAVYAADALISALLQDWMSVAFHALAGYFIFKGIQRSRELARTPAGAVG